MADRARLLDLIDRFAASSVVLYGDLVLDRFVLGTPKRISREAPVIILRYESQQDIPGGAANALANLRALDVRVKAVGAVGDDEPGEALRLALDGCGVDTSGVVSVAGFHTPTKVRILGGGSGSLKHQVARYDIEDQLSDEGPWRAEIENHLIAACADAAAIAVSDYGYGTVTTKALALINKSKRSENQHPWICLDSRRRVGSILGVDAATPNQGELEAHVGRTLTNDDEVAAAAEALRCSLGARFVLATRGNRGMTLVEASAEPFHIPIYGTDEVADVTGAGDTVLAVLSAALAAGASPQEAASLANYAGGIVVMKLGTATVNRAELRSAVEHDLGGQQ